MPWQIHYDYKYIQVWVCQSKLTLQKNQQPEIINRSFLFSWPYLKTIKNPILYQKPLKTIPQFPRICQGNQEIHVDQGAKESHRQQIEDWNNQNKQSKGRLAKTIDNSPMTCLDSGNTWETCRYDIYI